MLEFTASYLLLVCRDVIEVRMDLGGVPCIISDTAGLRSHSDDVIEIEGMKRARYGRCEAIDDI